MSGTAKFSAERSSLPGVLVIRPRVFEDARGFFLETWNRRDFAALGIEADFVQDNHSRSRRGTLRGLHFQRRRPQAKLIRVLLGRVFDVAVDLRRGSPTEGEWFGLTLDADERAMLYIPAGLAHGFLTLSEEAELAYKCSAYHDPGDEGGLLWCDPQLGIDWPLEPGSRPLLSDRDRNLPALEELAFRFEPEES
ncbi:MAG: dTDP-4-dehydrorhamnose 3,5-epimerase [Deltaproteobacteria bacterium]|nr:dTDP-4-dehydrorhamnose 3,5-epimerase [Deltaproteobacteria bacterium]